MLHSTCFQSKSFPKIQTIENYLKRKLVAFVYSGSAGSGVEGILQNLPGGVSHLPPGIVPVSGAMDFDVGLGEWPALFAV